MYNSNNYGYNPYGTYMPQRPVQQPLQQPLQNSAELCRPILNGKQVDSLEVVKAMDIPLDGISYFPLLDGSAIITKQIQLDGTSKITVFKPITDTIDENKYITQEDMKKALESLNIDELDDIKDDIKDLKQSIKDLKKKKGE